jgi:hypothetical protein
MKELRPQKGRPKGPLWASPWLSLAPLPVPSHCQGLPALGPRGCLIQGSPDALDQEWPRDQEWPSHWKLEAGRTRENSLRAAHHTSRCGSQDPWEFLPQPSDPGGPIRAQILDLPQMKEGISVCPPRVQGSQREVGMGVGVGEPLAGPLCARWKGWSSPKS